METNTLSAGERACLNCGALFKNGRTDKKFCSTECKTDYNNKLKKEQLKPEPAPPPAGQQEIPDFMELKMKLIPELQQVIDILLNNRNMLYDLCTEERAGHIRMRDLEKKGFNKHFITSQDLPNKNGHVYRFCFDYGYRINPDDTAVVICRPREIAF